MTSPLACYRACRLRPEGPHPDCRRAASTYEAKRQVRRQRTEGGVLAVPTLTLGAAMRAAKTAGISCAEVAAALGSGDVNYPGYLFRGSRPTTTRTKGGAFAKTLRAIVAARIETLEQVLDHLDAWERPDAGCNDGMRWPTAPLRQWAVDHGVAVHNLLNQADARYIYRNPTLDTDRAERFTNALQVHPEHVWGMAWFGIDDQQVAS